MTEAEKPDLTSLTVQLLSAYVSNNTVPSSELAELIRTTRGALEDNPPSDELPEPVFEPKVSVRKSLGSRDHIVSMIDGKPYKSLKRHLSSHGLTPSEYRARYKLASDYPMVAPGYSEQRREVAQRLGLGRKKADGSAGDAAPAASQSGEKPSAAAHAPLDASPGSSAKTPPAAADAPPVAATKPAKRPTPKAKAATPSGSRKARKAAPQSKGSDEKAVSEKPAEQPGAKAADQKVEATSPQAPAKAPIGKARKARTASGATASAVSSPEPAPKRGSPKGKAASVAPKAKKVAAPKRAPAAENATAPPSPNVSEPSVPHPAE